MKNLYDEQEYKKSESIEFNSYDTFIQGVLINKEKTLFDDRKYEVSKFLNITEEEVDETLQVLIEQNKPQNRKKIILDLSTDEKVISSYLEIQTITVISQMLRYTRFNWSYPLLQYFNHLYDKNTRKEIRIMDYGCGAADQGLSFASNGYDVTICDIEGGNLDFAKWRFEQRNLSCNEIPVDANNIYPEFEKLDIIIAGEILEHIRHPLITVKNFYNSLPIDGYLWVSDYPFEKKELFGHHLPEADECRLEVLEFIKDNFEIIKDATLEGILLKKKQ